MTMRTRFARFAFAAAGVAAVVARSVVAAEAQPLEIIDTHAHVDGKTRTALDYLGAAKVAISAMDRAAISLALVMPPPQPANFPYEWECNSYRNLPNEFARRFALVCGGGTINPLIVRHGRDPQIEDSVRKRVAELVEGFIGLGAVGLGEFAAEHFSFHPGHPYIAVPPDHPMFLLLAELAAKHGLPIELHMEAITREFVFPEALRRISSRNPQRVAPNMAHFERLLAHKRNANIVWAHAGWDNTRQRTVALMRDLLARHPNLYMSIGVHPSGPGSAAYLTSDGNLQPAFMGLIEEYSDRFMIGIDGFYALAPTHASIHTDARIKGAQALLGNLSSPAARRVAFENAVRVYRLREKGVMQ